MSGAVASVVLALAAERDAGSSFCPSEAARRLEPEDWRARMGEVHATARALAAAGHVVLTQGGREVTPLHVRGPYHILAAPASDPRLPSLRPEAYPAPPAIQERDSADA